MSIRTSMAISLALLCSAPLSAQTCSGGIDGGMDAQGCDCNDPSPASGSTAHAAPAETPVSGETAANGAAAEWARGIDAYEVGHYTEAIAELRRAAEHGHPVAAEMLALMYRFGEHLYGSEVHADTGAAAYFTALAAGLRRSERVAE